VIYRLFMHVTRDALQKVARQTLGLTLGMLIILHTWNQEFQQHVWAGSYKMSHRQTAQYLA